MSETVSWKGPRPFFGSHVLGSSSIRVYDADRIEDELYDKVLPDAIIPTNWTVNTIKTHMHSLLNKLPRKLDSLILVNTGLFNYKITQAAVNAVTNGTTGVKIIPSLMARFLYITNNIQTPIKEDQHVLILTKVGGLTDFHVLQRKNSIYNFIYEFQGYPINVPSLFKKYASKYIEDGGIAVILYDEANRTLNDEIVRECSNINIIQTVCPNWDEMLLHGGINKAATVMSQDTKNAYDVQDFTIGFHLINGQTCSDGDKSILIKVGASIPIKFYEEKELEKRVKTKMLIWRAMA
uniref:Uncharacterized protein n=1 Tax=Panagrolaimus superbus TaxID=310955 RepID=A0A914YES1_9BILA